LRLEIRQPPLIALRDGGAISGQELVEAASITSGRSGQYFSGYVADVPLFYRSLSRIAPSCYLCASLRA
jgi:hypothetical protein